MRPPSRTAYSYLRFSSKKQATGASLKRQLDGTEAWCKTRNLRLDPINFRDLGISAFHGKNHTEGALSAFLQAIRSGRIKGGSVLVIEKLDRLSRDEITDSLTVFIEIIKAGVEIHSILDGKVHSREAINKNPMELMYSVIELAKARDFSLTLSKRVTDAQERKRAAARQGKPGTKRCPFWLQLVNDKFQLIPERVAVMERIIEMATDGFGPVTLAKRLNREKVVGPSGKGWALSTLQHLLKSRTLIGEYQPGTRPQESAWKPSGKPIANYYPALISEEKFYRLQSVVAARAVGRRGRRGKAVANLFGRVLVSGQDGGTMTITRKNKNIATMASVRGLNGEAPFRGFHYPTFEREFLLWVTELRLQPTQEAVDRTTELTGRIAEKQRQIDRTKAKAAAAGDDATDELLDLIQIYGLQKRRLEIELATERSNRHGPAVGEAQRDVQDIYRLMKTLTGEELRAIREQLRTKISLLCRKIRVYIDGNRVRRYCLAWVALADGTHRVFAIRTERNRPTVTTGLPKAVKSSDIDAHTIRYLIGLTDSVAAKLKGGN